MNFDRCDNLRLEGVGWNTEESYTAPQTMSISKESSWESIHPHDESYAPKSHDKPSCDTPIDFGGDKRGAGSHFEADDKKDTLEMEKIVESVKEKEKEKERKNSAKGFDFDPSLFPSCVSSVNVFSSGLDKARMNNAPSKPPRGQSDYKPGPTKESSKSRVNDLVHQTKAKGNPSAMNQYGFDNGWEKPGSSKESSNSRVNDLVLHSKAKASPPTMNQYSFDNAWGGPSSAKESSKSRVNDLVLQTKAKGNSPAMNQYDFDDGWEKPGSSKESSKNRVNDLVLQSKAKESSPAMNQYGFDDGFGRAPRIKDIPEEGAGYVKTGEGRKPFQRAAPREDPSAREYNRGHFDNNERIVDHHDEYWEHSDGEMHHVGPRVDLHEEFYWKQTGEYLDEDPNYFGNQQTGQYATEEPRYPTKKTLSITSNDPFKKSWNEKNWNAHSQDARFVGEQCAEEWEPEPTIPPVQTHQAYQAPIQVHQAPTLAYQAPTQAYQAPTMAYQAPTTAYQAPVQVHQAPIQAHQAQAHQAPTHTQTHQAPTHTQAYQGQSYAQACQAPTYVQPPTYVQAPTCVQAPTFAQAAFQPPHPPKVQIQAQTEQDKSPEAPQPVYGERHKSLLDSSPTHIPGAKDACAPSLYQPDKVKLPQGQSWVVCPFCYNGFSHPPIITTQQDPINYHAPTFK